MTRSCPVKYRWNKIGCLNPLMTVVKILDVVDWWQLTISSHTHLHTHTPHQVNFHSQGVECWRGRMCEPQFQCSWKQHITVMSTFMHSSLVEWYREEKYKSALVILNWTLPWLGSYHGFTKTVSYCFEMWSCPALSPHILTNSLLRESRTVE